MRITDLPQDERLTVDEFKEWLKNIGPYSSFKYQDKVDRYIKLIESEDACPVAMPFFDTGKYIPCAVKPMEGEKFCHIHGGKVKRHQHIEFGRAVREARKAKGLSLRELAEEVGVDFTYLSKIENGHLSPPSEEAIAFISMATGADFVNLVVKAGKNVPLAVQKYLLKHPEMLREIYDSAIKERYALSDADMAKEVVE